MADISYKIPYTKYIAYNNTEAAQGLLSTYNFQPATNVVELTNTLSYIAKNDKDHGLENVLAIHPDKEAILDFFGTQPEEEKAGADGGEKKLGCGADGSGCGCSSFSGGCRDANGRKGFRNKMGGCGFGEDLSADATPSASSSDVVTKSDLQSLISSLKPSSLDTNQLLFGGAMIAIVAVLLLRSK